MARHFATFYRDSYTPKPIGAGAWDWSRLVEYLMTFKPITGAWGDKEHRKRVCPLWAPHRLADGATRAAANVVEVSMLVIDYDDDMSPRGALEQWRGVEAVAYTTWHHRPHEPRCRLVMPLAKPLPGEHWSELYGAAVAGADMSCRDPSRGYYAPAIGAGGPHEAEHQEGALLNLAGDYEAAARRVAERSAMTKARAERARRRARGSTYTGDGDRDRQLRQHLKDDPEARRRVAEAAGAKFDQGGTVARGMTCPNCGRHEVWGHIATSPNVRCNHVNGCGWYGNILEMVMP